MYMLLGTENEKHVVRPYMPCLLHDLSSTLCYASTVFPQLMCLFVFMCRLSLGSTLLAVQSTRGVSQGNVVGA